MEKAEIAEEDFHYSSGNTNFRGRLYNEIARKSKGPGAIVFHAFGGLSEFEHNVARALASNGFVALAADVYGDAKRATSTDEAYSLMSSLDSDRRLLRKRLTDTLEAFCRHPLVDTETVGAVGYCFGGKCALDLARASTPLNIAVSVHGLYDKPNLPAGTFSTKVRVLHGWDDQLSKPDDLVALCEELTDLEADWQVVCFGGAAHSFTNPKASAPEQGIAYHPQAAASAARYVLQFLKEGIQKSTDDL